MNSVDVRFKKLCDFIDSKNEKELFDHILMQYKFLPKQLQDIHKNYFDKFRFWGQIDLDNNNFEYFTLKAKDIKNGIEDIKWLYDKLEDYSSKRLFVAILDNYINYNVELLASTVDKQNKHYFDLDLIEDCQNEVFVDLGAYVGDTVLDFIQTYGLDCYKKIICYEITSSIYQKLINNTMPYKNIDCRLKAVKDKVGHIAIEQNENDISSNKTKVGQDIECVTLDQDVLEPITMLKMDIEGDEPYALKGCREHITNDCPKLMISVYHNNRHLWELPKLINSYNKNYKFYLRNYCGTLYPTEIVLFGIPKNKKN